jgi:RNA polymerase sigma-70 factor, ECF subfamily
LPGTLTLTCGLTGISINLRRGRLSAWLTRIAVNEALARQRARARNEELDGMDNDGGLSMKMADTAPDPEETATRTELGQLQEEAVLGLPEDYRTVVMLRDVEEMSPAETATALELTEQNVR